MRIDSKDTIGGAPILAIRKMLGKHRHYGFAEEHVCGALDIAPESAAALVEALHGGGYIRPDRYGFWRNTTKGNALANASAAKPLKRSTAERQLRSFLGRVQAVNAPDSQFLFRVERVALFGSLLTDAPDVSDVDLCVELKPVRDDGEWLLKEAAKQADAAGREMHAWQAVFWTKDRVGVFLKNRSRAISMCPWEDEWLRKVNHKGIYQRDSGD